MRTMAAKMSKGLANPRLVRSLPNQRKASEAAMTGPIMKIGYRSPQYPQGQGFMAASRVKYVAVG